MAARFDSTVELDQAATDLPHCASNNPTIKYPRWSRVFTSMQDTHVQNGEGTISVCETSKCHNCGILHIIRLCRHSIPPYIPHLVKYHAIIKYVQNAKIFQNLKREKLENIHAFVPFNLVCQKFSGLISGVMPELWQSKPFGARKDFCAPFSLYHLSGHT